MIFNDDTHKKKLMMNEANQQHSGQDLDYFAAVTSIWKDGGSLRALYH